MKHLYALTFAIICTITVSAQNFKGKITDKSGEALYGSSIYIKGINQGLVCNDEGYYQTTVPSGNYLVEYKCLGFKSKEQNIKILSDKITTIDIILEENPFTLKEVTVSSQEDPAYPIMRKAIEKAPLHARAVKEYNAEVYIKGNAELLNVGGFVDNLSKKGEGIKLSEFKNKVFVQESFNEIKFSAPDKYKQTVKAFSSSIPDNMDSKDAMGITNSSIYMPKMGSYISPLNPKAFSYYKYRYDGFSEEKGLIINKIKVEAKLKDPVLLDGYIYIADNSWHVTSAELKSNTYGAKQNYTVTFNELIKGAYLPIAYNIISDIDLFSIKAKVNYYASLKYIDIKVNEEIVKELNDKKKQTKRSFEIKKDTLYTRIADTLATKRDSTYWTNIRAIPLGEREIASFEKKDSIQNRLDSVRKKHQDPKFSFMDIFDGGKIGKDSSKVVFSYEGLLQAIPEYNFVDGLWIGQRFKIKSRLSKKNILEISPYIYYTTARKRWIGGGDINLSYAPMRLGNLKISAGSVSEDFNQSGIYRLNNALSSLITGKNYNHFYQKDYISVINKIDISNGLVLSAGFEIAKRYGLSNKTDYTWGKKSKITPNMFSNERFDRTVYIIGVDYTPYAYYSVKDGIKKYERFASPTVYLRYNEGFSSWQTNNSQYRKISAGLYQNIKLSEFNRFDYFVEGGAFFGNKDNTHFADYQHFNTSSVLINLKSPFTSFMLLDNYAASTNKHWVKGEFNYHSKYILLKRLPFLQGKMFTEALHLKSLYTPDMKMYTEAGYSVNLMQLLNAGIFASFKKEKYQDFGIRISFDLNAAKKAF